MANSLYPPLHPANLRRSIEAQVPVKAMRDVVNRLRFGPGAPLSDECLFVDPQAIQRGYAPDPARGAPHFRRRDSGRVVGGDWDRSVGPTGQNIKYKACLAHFRDGVPWKETGLFEEMLARIGRHGVADGCRTLADIEARYAALDALANEAARTGQFKPRRDLDGAYFRREHGGVLVLIARDGEVLRTGGGQHRFAIAQALNLKEMPVQLGVIHREAFEAGLLEPLRQSRFRDAPST